MSASFKPSGKSAYESYASLMVLSDDGRLFLSTPTYEAAVRITVASGPVSAGLKLTIAEARALAAELLIACDASESAQKVAA